MVPHNIWKGKRPEDHLQGLLHRRTQGAAGAPG